MILNKELNDKLQTQLLSPQMSDVATHRVHFNFDDVDTVTPPPPPPPPQQPQPQIIIKNVADHSKCNKIINNLKITVNTYLNKSKKLENNLKDKENEIKILEKKLDSKNDEINQLSLIKSVTHSRENSNLSSGSSSGEIKTPDNHAQCNTRIKNLQVSLNNYLNVLKKNENEINEKNKKIIELQNRNLTLQQTNNNVTIIKNINEEADHSECEKRISDLENEIENLKTQLQDCNNNNNNNAIEEVETDHSECIKKMKDLQEQVDSLKEENEEILTNYTNGNGDNNDSLFEKKIHDLENENNNYKLENDKLLNEIKKLKSHGKDEKQAIYIRELEEKLRTITFQINTIKKRTKTVIIENGDMDDQLKEKDDIIKALRNALNKHNLLIKSIPNNV